MISSRGCDASSPASPCSCHSAATPGTATAAAGSLNLIAGEACSSSSNTHARPRFVFLLLLDTAATAITKRARFRRHTSRNASRLPAMSTYLQGHD